MNTNTMTTKQDYQLQAKEALAKCNVSMEIKLSNTKIAPWESDPAKRYHYIITLIAGKIKYSFDFWGSALDYINKKSRISEYDVLACLSSSFHTPIEFAEFCADFGYDTDSIKAHKTWLACLEQRAQLNKIFPKDSQKEFISEIQ